MSQFSIVAQKREELGKEKNKKLRRAGRVPAVIYGSDYQPVSLTVDQRELGLLLQRIRGEKVLVDLEFNGAKEKVFVRDVQRDPVKEHALHVDFFRIDETKPINTIIQVVSVGQPAGIKEGGVLEHGIRSVHIKALPTKVPPHLEVDVAGLHVGQSIHLRDIQAPEGVTFTSSGDAVLFALVHKTKATEAEEAAEGAAAAAAAPAAAAPAKAAPAKG